MQPNLTICYLRKVTDRDSDEFYRKLHTGNAGDVEFYRRVCSGAASVLELGCGWGRIAGPLLEAGHRVMGIDHSKHFIELSRHACAEHAAATFSVGDIRDLHLQDEDGMTMTFDRILIPYNTLYSLGGRAGVLGCLKSARAHLEPEGEIWCDIYPVDDMHRGLLDGEEPPPDDDEPVASFEWKGKNVHVLERSHLDPRNQHLDVKYVAVDENRVEVASLEMNHDYLLFAELDALFEEAGLGLMSVYGDFAGGSVDEPEQLVVGAEALCAE